jgi:hypothetical protein
MIRQPNSKYVRAPTFTNSEWDAVVYAISIIGAVLTVWSLLNEPALTGGASLVTATTTTTHVTEVASDAVIAAHARTQAPTTSCAIPYLHEVGFMLHAALLVLVLDALASLVFYFRKRSTRSTWPPVPPPIRPTPFSMLVIAEVAAVTSRITHAIGCWLHHARDTAFSSVSCAGRRQVQYKNSTVLVPCSQSSNDTWLHECKTAGPLYHLCKYTAVICHLAAMRSKLQAKPRTRSRPFGNCLYHGSSDAGVITIITILTLHPTHVITVLAVLVSSSSICNACMQLWYTAFGHQSLPRCRWLLPRGTAACSYAHIRSSCGEPRWW